MDNGSYLMTLLKGNSQPLHKPTVSDCNGNSVHSGCHAVSADLFNVLYTGTVYFFSVSSLETPADRMGRRTLCQRRIFQDFMVFHYIVMHTADLKHTFCQCSCFIKHHISGLSKSFHIIGSLYQYTGIACSADSCKKAEGNTDHKGAGTADYQKCQRTVNPVSPLGIQSHKHQPDKRRKNCQRQRTVTDYRRIITGKFGYKIFGSGFP